MQWEGNWYDTEDWPKNQYRYNGKELNSDFGLDWYAYGARYYDPEIGRFTGVDPIADQFPHLSTFNYASNDPINNVDLHGLQGVNHNDLGAVIGGNIRAAYEQLKYNIWRNHQILLKGADPNGIPYRKYKVSQNEWSGQLSVTYQEAASEPNVVKRMVDNTLAGADLASMIPSRGEVAAFSKIPGGGMLNAYRAIFGKGRPEVSFKVYGSLRRAKIGDSGVYRISFEDGSVYIGRGGGLARAKQSAQRAADEFNGTVVSIEFWNVEKQYDTEILEHVLLQKHGGPDAPNVLNKIDANPGKTSYQNLSKDRRPDYNNFFNEY